MRRAVLIGLMTCAGMAQAAGNDGTPDMWRVDEVSRSPFAQPDSRVESSQLARIGHLPKLPCPEGTKEVGDDCVPLAEFE